MTDERKQIVTNVIADYIGGSEDKAGELFEMSAENAAQVLNASGADITPEELSEVGKEINEAADRIKANGGELDEIALDNVAGGRSYSWLPGLGPIIFSLPLQKRWSLIRW